MGERDVSSGPHSSATLAPGPTFADVFQRKRSWRITFSLTESVLRFVFCSEYAFTSTEMYFSKCGFSFSVQGPVCRNLFTDWPLDFAGL